MPKRKNVYLPSALLVALFLIVWQALAMGMDAAYILPSPVQVVLRLWALRGPLFTAHLPATMSVTLIGLGFSLALGVALALLMDASPTAEHALYPLIVASQTIPTTALAPLRNHGRVLPHPVHPCGNAPAGAIDTFRRAL